MKSALIKVVLLLAVISNGTAYAFDEGDAQAQCMTMTEEKGYQSIDWAWFKSKVTTFDNGNILVVFPFTAKNAYNADIPKRAVCSYDAKTNRITLKIT